MNKVKVNRKKRTVKTIELEQELETEQEHEQG